MVAASWPAATALPNALFVAIISATFFFLATLAHAFEVPTSITVIRPYCYCHQQHKHHPSRPTSPPSCRLLAHPSSASDCVPTNNNGISSNDYDDTITMDVMLSSHPALQRLDLTSDQMALIQMRVNGYRTPKQKRNHHPNKSDDHLSSVIESNLSYLEERLDLTLEQLRILVVGYPPLLGFNLDTNLMPTVEFFGDALRDADAPDDARVDDNDDSSSGVDNSNEMNRQRRHRNQLATFLCKSPSLLEYNVAKRLMPRLARVRQMMSLVGVDKGDGSGGGSPSTTSLDEEMVVTIATLTESRFDTWLLMQNNNETTRKNKNEDGNIAHSTVGVDSNQHRQQQRNLNHPSSHVIVSNLQSGGNIGNIIRSASIFGCQEIIVVGQKRYRLTGDHGSRMDLPRRHCYSHSEAQTYLQDKGVRIYGIEIMEGAKPIMEYDPSTGVVEFPFKSIRDEDGGGWSGAAFIFGNEGQGLSSKQKDICDEFIFIPQNRGGSVDGGGSASMNVACAAAVILQSYCMWAGYSGASRVGQKFVES